MFFIVTKKEENNMKTTTKGRFYGPVMMLCAALCFSLGGILCKWIPWSGISINGARSAIAVLVMGIFMLVTHHPLKINRTVLTGALWTFGMTTCYVIANKLTTAANAIVLEYTSSIWIVLLMLILFHRKPTKNELITIAVTAIGILFFFFDSLSGGGMLGNCVGLLSGLMYANVFLLNSYEDGDAMSSLVLGLLAGAVFLSPFAVMEADHSPTVLLAVALMGAVQMGAAYILFALGTAHTQPVAASLIATVEPVINPILVAIFWGETIQPLSLVGAVIVIGAVLVYNLRSSN